MSDPYIGEIRLFAGKTAPQGWHVCDGTVLPVAQYQALYALLGNVYGGTAPVSFALPDLRGRVPVGTGTGVVPDTNPAASLTPRTLGSSGGAETVTLEGPHLPPHTHALYAGNGPATTSTPGTAVTFANTTGQVRSYVSAAGVPSQAKAVKTATGTIASSTTAQPHDNMMPTMALNHIIALVGLYPVRP
ncbi:tail fiber protein [Pseudomonas silvicola]|nr:tail fiber protein [Pseudomonas silvicola]